MKVAPITRQGYELLHRGALELARVEGNGFLIDTSRLERTEQELNQRIGELKEKLQKGSVWRAWRKRFGFKTKLGSREQFGKVLTRDLGIRITRTTDTGRPKMDEEALADIDHPYVQDFMRLMKLDKALGTFIHGIKHQLGPDGRLHPVFNLHIARTYRSSSDSPNFQNFPVRDKEISELVRSLFIAPSGSLIGESDFKGIEVCVSAAYHKDPRFISYITKPSKDMHRDMAAQLYLLETGDVQKNHRYGGKNKFVFPQFYGDYYVNCARGLWDWIEKGDLKGPNGEPLKEHLKAKGIRKCGECDPDKKPKPGTFEHHVRAVEDDFWNRRFRAYGQWRRDWFKQYLQQGYFDTLSGFRLHGTFGRNQVVNYPVQGAAFHCLLWSMCELMRALRRYKMKTLVIGQIHDSIISEIREKELGDYLSILEEIVSEQLPKHYAWLNVPMQIECELCAPGASWFHKREVVFMGGRFAHPTKQGKWIDAEDSSEFLRLFERN